MNRRVSLTRRVRRVTVAIATVGAMLTMTGGMIILSGSPASAASCTSVSTSKGTLTAAVVNTNVSGTVTLTGCDIGVYFGPNVTGTVSNAVISDFIEYGVFNDGGSVTVTDSTISNIGDSPFDGMQYGVGVYFNSPNGSTATGTISGNTITNYQKGGITVNGIGSNAIVTGNKVLGVNQVPYIAQNGIQFGFGAAGSVSGNTIDGNWYTGAGWTSTGLLLFDVNASQVKTSHNLLRNNQTEFALIESNACSSMYDGFYGGYDLCPVAVS